MEKEFSSVLEGVLRYENKEHIIVSCLFIICLVMVAFWGIKRYRLISLFEKIVILLIILILIIVFLSYIIFGQIYKNSITSDIFNEDFVIYNGRYIHDDYQKDSFYHNLYIIEKIGEKTLLRYPDYSNQYNIYRDFRELPTGSFTGTIVYGKKSKIVVYWTIE